MHLYLSLTFGTQTLHPSFFFGWGGGGGGGGGEGGS